MVVMSLDWHLCHERKAMASVRAWLMGEACHIQKGMNGRSQAAWHFMGRVIES